MERVSAIQITTKATEAWTSVLQQARVELSIWLIRITSDKYTHIYTNIYAHRNTHNTHTHFLPPQRSTDQSAPLSPTDSGNQGLIGAVARRMITAPRQRDEFCHIQQWGAELPLSSRWGGGERSWKHPGTNRPLRSLTWKG